MLPVREVRPRPLVRPPWVVLALVAANLAVFLGELSTVAAEGSAAVLEHAFVPRLLLVDPGRGLATIFTSMFLHGGWAHLLGNLWFLWIFGPSVEEALGSRRFGALYLLGGVGAALAQAAVDPFSPIPMLGASGAIGAVLAAYVSLYPLRRVLSLAFVFFLEIPELFFVLEWFVINLFRGIGALDGATGGVAWWAHVGGFLAGLVLVRALFPREPEKPRFEIEVRGPRGERYSVRTFHPGNEA